MGLLISLVASLPIVVLFILLVLYASIYESLNVLPAATDLQLCPRNVPLDLAKTLVCSWCNLGVYRNGNLMVALSVADRLAG